MSSSLSSFSVVALQDRNPRERERTGAVTHGTKCLDRSPEVSLVVVGERSLTGMKGPLYPNCPQMEQNISFKERLFESTSLPLVIGWLTTHPFQTSFLLPFSTLEAGRTEANFFVFYSYR